MTKVSEEDILAIKKYLEDHSDIFDTSTMNMLNFLKYSEEMQKEEK